MADFLPDLTTITEKHRRALKWFEDNRGKRIPWADITANPEEDGGRLVTAAKGIFKPAELQYALSVRTLQDGPYPDKEVVYRPDGTWVTQYFQENRDPSRRDEAYTNLGLMRCLEDKVPVGFLIKRNGKAQRKGDPGVDYEVVGLGYVIGWDEGYFTIEGLSPQGSSHALEAVKDAARSRAIDGTRVETEAAPEFDAANDEDLRSRVIGLVARRRGQAKFRAGLLEAYEGRCCVSGCDFFEVLEAAHINPYRGDHSNSVQNGLLLRADLHTLFDLGHLTFSDDRTVILSPQAQANPTYAPLHGTKIALPKRPDWQPSLEALARHRAWCGLVG